ncbi:hypothetical protein ABFX02_09G046200 [Erythranthe guttata]
MEEDDGDVRHQKPSPEENIVRVAKEMPFTFGKFTVRESWDFFFASRSGDDFCEWYSDWPRIRTSLTAHLLFPSWKVPPPPENVRILVPACGNSKLSEHLYDDGFTDITNVDFSKVLISAMLKRNIRERPLMKWRVMDITNMTFPSGTFDAIVDKGGLDVLVEPESSPRLGTLYLSEVKRLLKAGGKYIFFTLPESVVLGLLFSKFRFGWKINLYGIAQTKLPTIMVVAEKDTSTSVSNILSSMDEYSSVQCQALVRAVERENLVRTEYSNGIDVWHSLEDLKLGVRGDIKVLETDRIVRIVFGEPGESRFFYTAVLIDTNQESGTFTDGLCIYFFEKTRASERVLSSEWQLRTTANNAKAARMLIVILDSSHAHVCLHDAMEDIYGFISELSPGGYGDQVSVSITPAGDGMKETKIVHQVTSAMTGPIVVDDVIYTPGAEEVAFNLQCLPKEFNLRRLSFKRTDSLVHSVALLSTQGPNEISSEVDTKNTRKTSKAKSRKFDSRSSDSHREASSGETKVDHKVLASFFHTHSIAGLVLFSLYSQLHCQTGGLVKIVVIGLGAGLLPMFMRNCLPSLHIEVVEIDPVVLNIARDYFGFREDEHLKVHIADAMKFVSNKATFKAEGKDSLKIDVLIIDVDSSDTSSGLVCPDADFVEETFFLTVKESLSENGIFIFNLVSRFPGVRGAIHSRLKKVFRNLYHYWSEIDFNEVIYALKSDAPVDKDQLSEACDSLAISLQYKNQHRFREIIRDSKLIEPLR